MSEADQYHGGSRRNERVISAGWCATVSPACEENTLPVPIRAVSSLYTDGKNGRRREQLRHTNTLMDRIHSRIPCMELSVRKEQSGMKK